MTEQEAIGFVSRAFICWFYS